MYLNKVMLIGNLTKDPELKALPSGVKVCNFSIATNRTWKDKDGAKKEDVEFHTVVSFGKQAETIHTYFKKGDQIYLEGRLQTRNWEDKESGKKLYKTEVIAEMFQFGQKSGKARENTQDEGNIAQAPKNATAGNVGANSGDTIEYPTEEISPEDIPF